MFHSPVYHSRIHKSPVYHSMPGIVAAGEVSTHALSFDGVDDYVNCGRLTATESISQVTLCGWFKRSAANAKLYAGRANAVTSAGRIAIEGWSDGQIYIEVYDTGAVAQYGYFASNDTNWHHIALVFDGALSGNANRLKGYIDGVQQSLTFVGTIPAATSAETGPFYIGTLILTNYSSGLQDDIRIYNVALTAPQIAAMYANTTPAPTAGLVGHWKFDEGSGTVAADSSVYGNAGTLSGPTWTTDVPAQLA